MLFIYCCAFVFNEAQLQAMHTFLPIYFQYGRIGGTFKTVVDKESITNIELK